MNTTNPSRPAPRRRPLLVGTLVLLLVLVVGAAVLIHTTTQNAPSRNAGPRPTASTAAPSTAPYVPPTATQVAALPEAKYDAVIPTLLPYAQEAPKTASTTYTLTTDTPIYAADQITPVARFAGRNFLNNPTVVTPVRISGPWALVLTPARKTLPSKTAGNAAAQTAGWVRLTALHNPVALKQRIVVSVSKQTLTITGTRATQVFTVGVGATKTPTPTGVSGYLQARYLDPAQNQTTYPIQLTSLHSAAADEPYSGHDGGLIGVHYYPTTTGDISHGCIRLTAPAITAVTKLPLGTLVTITK